MNKIESAVYGLVRKNPAVKQFVRNCYQSVFDLLPKGKEYFRALPDIKEGFFFGFHDVTPWSGDETKLLACHNEFDLRMPNRDEGLHVGYFDFNEGKMGEYHKLDRSYAWNYHKGCRLQWVDNNSLIFNTSQDGRVCSKIIDLSTGSRSAVPYCIDAVYCDGDAKLATSFSYERLERCMPGYGYPYEDNGMTDIDAPEDTGLFLIDLCTMERTLAVSLKDLAECSAQSANDGFIHFVTHSEFSKNGRYISFLYRRVPRNGNYMKRWTRIMVLDRMTNELITLPSQESGSHYVWNNADQLLASCIIDGKSCHVLFDMDNIDNYKIIASDVLNSDGHQSFVSDTLFVTDTYPDRRRMACLYSADITSGNTELIAKIYSPKRFQTKDFKCHIACDLHPRISPSGRFVSFDSPSTGKRGIYVMKI